MTDYSTKDFGSRDNAHGDTPNGVGKHSDHAPSENGLFTQPSHVEAMEKIARSMSISGELFEKLYLSPAPLSQTGDFRKRFANPTPVALVGFLLCISPASCQLMDWRGSGAQYYGASVNGAYWFFGVVLMFFGGLLEFILGNTFSFVVFASFSGFWGTYGATLTEQFDAFTTYALAGETSGSGAESPVFQAGFAFFLCFMGVLCLIYLVCSIRTNLVFFGIFLVLVPSFGCFAAAFWWNAQGRFGFCLTLLKVGGAGFFVVGLLGWYLLLVQLLAAVDLYVLPVGDLSHIITPASQRMAHKAESHEKV